MKIGDECVVGIWVRRYSMRIRNEGYRLVAEDKGMCEVTMNIEHRI